MATRKRGKQPGLFDKEIQAERERKEKQSYLKELVESLNKPTPPKGGIIIPDLAQVEVPNLIPPQVDNVNHPPHYTQGGIECIDALAAATAKLEGIEAVCTANAIKYLWRWKDKGGAEDLRKARWYINRLLGENNE